MVLWLGALTSSANASPSFTINANRLSFHDRLHHTRVTYGSFLNALLHQLLSQSWEPDLNIEVVLVIDPNIFAGIGPQQGSSTIKIRVTTGLLETVESVDELAMIIGHELGHFTDTADIQQTLKLMDATQPALKMELATLTAQHNSPYYQERADHFGMALGARAGYNPAAAVSIMNKLKVAMLAEVAMQKRLADVLLGLEWRCQRLQKNLPFYTSLYLPPGGATGGELTPLPYDKEEIARLNREFDPATFLRQ